MSMDSGGSQEPIVIARSVATKQSEEQGRGDCHVRQGRTRNDEVRLSPSPVGEGRGEVIICERRTLSDFQSGRSREDQLH